ncbi:MAG: acyl-CoA dehydrogenase family protein, partial [Limnohabitans sp.]
MCGDDDPLTEKQQKLMALARQLGRDKFAGRAAQLDRDAQFPFANYEDMRQAGLLGLCVPEEHGGHGADYATSALVSAEIGRYCGATALTFNM